MTTSCSRQCRSRDLKESVSIIAMRCGAEEDAKQRQDSVQVGMLTEDCTGLCSCRPRDSKGVEVQQRNALRGIGANRARK